MAYFWWKRSSCSSFLVNLEMYFISLLGRSKILQRKIWLKISPSWAVHLYKKTVLLRLYITRWRYFMCTKPVLTFLRSSTVTFAIFISFVSVFDCCQNFRVSLTIDMHCLLLRKSKMTFALICIFFEEIPTIRSKSCGKTSYNQF